MQGGNSFANTGTVDLPAMLGSYAGGGEVSSFSSSGSGQGQGNGVQAALRFGRQQMGLPSNFSSGESEQSFEDGGEVDEQGAIPEQPVTGGGNTPNPQALLGYLSGEGAVSPEIASALEKHVDPQGSMPPAQRTVAAINAAPTDEAKFGMLQHYRTKYNAYAGGAQAAADKGNFAEAAKNANMAMAALPTGKNFQFAPAPGGVAMRVGGGAPVPQPQQAAPQANPAVEQGQEQSFEDGGEVDDEENDLPAIPEAPMQAQAAQEPDATAEATDEDDDEDMGGTPAVPEQPQAQAQESAPAPQAQPEVAVLRPEDFKALFKAGFDKPLDDGWGQGAQAIPGIKSRPSSPSVTSMPQPSASSAGSAQPRPWEVPADQALQSPEGAQTPAMKQVAGERAQRFLQQARDARDPAKQKTGSFVTEAREGDDLRLPTIEERRQAQDRARAEREGNWPSNGKDNTTGNKGDDASIKRYQAMAEKLFGNRWDAGPARDAWVEKQMRAELGAKDKLDLEKTKGQVRNEGAMARTQLVEGGRNIRSGNSIGAKRDATQTANETRARLGAVSDQVRMFNAMLAAGKTPAQAFGAVKDYADKIGANTDALTQHLRQGGGQQSAPARPAPAQPSQGQANAVIFPRGPHAGKVMIRRPDGMHVLAPGQ